MATKKAASNTKKSSTKTTVVQKPASAKTNVTTIRAVEVADRSQSKEGFRAKLPNNIVNIVIAEIIGTFVLTLVAVLSVSSLAPLYLGVALFALVIFIGVISGAHLNPAITFGLWTARRLRAILLPFYWVAQFVGAMAAVVLMSLLSHGKYGLDFANFWSLNWGVLVVELVGTAVFAFGFTAATSRLETSFVTRALSIGLSFAVGLLVASSLLSTLQGSIDQSKITSLSAVPHELRVKGALLNPALSLAATENTDAQLQGSNASSNQQQKSRLSLEVILGSFIGAAIGANLYRVTYYRNRQ